jgi:hypothetical protein
MLKPFRRAAVRVVKPRVSEETWPNCEKSTRNASLHVAAQSGQPGDSLRESPSRQSPPCSSLPTAFHQQRGTSSPCCRSASAGRVGTARTVQHCARGNTSSQGSNRRLDPDDKSFVNEKRISTYQGSQGRRRSVAQHRPETSSSEDHHRQRQPSPEDTRATFAILFPLLADGGYYAIEGTRTSYWPTLGGSSDVTSRTTIMSMIKDLLDGLNYRILVIIGHAATPIHMWSPCTATRIS